MCNKIDILENEILEKYPDVLDVLLRDHTTHKNILWATNNYDSLGISYSFKSEIYPELITGHNGNVIMPRVQKDKILQLSRVRNMAEVFTPSWICNAQNNLIDNSWFEKENVFNKETELVNGNWIWEVNPQKIIFPKNKTWKNYIRDKRLEMACGEAPYITSRYDTTTGAFIPIYERIGILDRKLRVINENVNTSGEWLNAAQTAFKSTYAYEWQGDSLLLAREAMLFTFIENYVLKFGKEPLLKSIKYIAYIISWNIWQMDGIKGVVPDSCETICTTTEILFGIEEIKCFPCVGCQKEVLKNHNGTYCIIKDWSYIDKTTGRKGKKIRFIDLLNN
ncbi:restriction endonuclease subunit M [Arenibacter sp. TNZ]|uniref:restriction endonuclease subunit M n=1 Tax=Arenibacter TaxID=178469 RepID=UPI000CD4157C|nr:MULTISPECIES: restriction endonuclease subunit M [Arenibacter]MCM4172452.1 restriction endonuclease subunit M [Arenibacter sp. TNZ]